MTIVQQAIERIKAYRAEWKTETRLWRKRQIDHDMHQAFNSVYDYLTDADHATLRSIMRG